MTSLLAQRRSHTLMEPFIEEICYLERKRGGAYLNHNLSITKEIGSRIRSTALEPIAINQPMRNMSANSN